MFAIVETGGKQYKIEKDSLLHVEKMDVPEGESVILNKVLLVQGDNGVVVGSPYIEGAQVKAQIRMQGKEKKIIVFKFKAKKNYRRKTGHRQKFTLLQVKDLICPGIS